MVSFFIAFAGQILSNLVAMGSDKFAEEKLGGKKIGEIDMDKMNKAVDGLTNVILKLQGDGDYAGVDQLVAEKGLIKADLAADLAKLTKANIPVDITFKQGKEVLGLPDVSPRDTEQ